MNKYTPTIELKKVSKFFKQGGQTLEVLKNADLEVMSGEVVALVGPSGSGKSTLLQIAGLLDKPTKGDVWLNGKKCGKLGDGDRTILRRDYLGFVYQYHNLLSDFDAVENVVLPQLIAGVKMKAATEKAKFLLQRLGLEKRFYHRPAALSGGEQQRVAIARALANSPKLLLADEPTGAVDNATATVILDLFRKINTELGITVVIVTHDMKLSAKVDRVIRIRDGRTSTEYIKLENSDSNNSFSFGAFDEDATHQEFVVVDRVGRLQIPAEMLSAAKISPMSRIKLEFDKDGHIVLIPFE